MTPPLRADRKMAGFGPISWTFASPPDRGGIRPPRGTAAPSLSRRMPPRLHCGAAASPEWAAIADA